MVLGFWPTHSKISSDFISLKTLVNLRSARGVIESLKSRMRSALYSILSFKTGNLLFKIAQYCKRNAKDDPSVSQVYESIMKFGALGFIDRNWQCKRLANIC